MSKRLDNRKQLARELRSTHFNLGHDDNTNAMSEYVEEYKKWDNRFDGNFGDRLGLKQSHFVLGTDSMQDPYKSLYKRDHVQFDKIAASTLDTEKLRDLRNHHFALGTDQGFPKSEAQEKFVPQQLPKGTKEDFDQVKLRNKAESLSFPDDANYFSSMYNESHNRNLDPTKTSKGFDKTDLRKQANELQSSHIMFGSNNDNYATSMSNAFVNKHGQYQRSGPPINLMQTNYVPGDDPIPTESMYKHYHKQFPIETAKLNDELRTDLRAHHFKFGDEGVAYESTAAGNYKEPGAESYKEKASNPLLQKNHFALGDYKPSYQTSYKTVHQEHDVQIPNRADDSKRDRTSNIVLGYAPLDNRSEAHSQYVAYKDPKKAQLDEALAKDLRNSHFNFDGKNTYESYSHAAYKDVLDKAKDLNPKGKSQELAADLRRNHFDYGTDGKQFRTTQRDAYQGLYGNKSNLEKELANDLRRNHFDIGVTGQLNKETTYGVNFGWKDPQDD